MIWPEPDIVWRLPNGHRLGVASKLPETTQNQKITKKNKRTPKQILAPFGQVLLRTFGLAALLAALQQTHAVTAWLQGGCFFVPGPVFVRLTECVQGAPAFG